MIARLFAIGRRFLLMLGGEFAQSAFAFCLNVSLARSLPADRYGIFAIVVLIGGFGLIYMRALFGVPACTFIPGSRRLATARLYGVMFGSGALAISVSGAALVSIVLALWQPDGAIGGGLFVGAWSLRSYVRMALFAQRRAALATICDLVFTVTAASLCLPAILYGPADSLLQNVFLSLSLAHVLASCLALFASRQPLRLSLRRTIRRRFVRLLPAMTWSLINVTVANIQGQGAVLLLAVIAGPAAYAPIAATMAFFSPLRMAAMALANMTQPDLAKTLSNAGPRGVISLLLLSTAMIGSVCVVYGIVMLWAFPPLAQHAFANRFGDAPLNLIAFYIWCIATVAVLYSVPKTLLEAGLRFKGTTMVSLIGTLVCMPTVAMLLIFVSPAMSLIGILASELIVLAGSWLLAIHLIRHRGAANISRLVPGAWLKGLIKHTGRPALDVVTIGNSGADA